MNLTLSLVHRPYSIELITGIMLPDGIFDGALPQQLINVHVRNDGPSPTPEAEAYIEGLSDPGIQVDAYLVAIPALEPGELHLCSWLCNFERSSPGKTRLSIRVKTKTGQTIRLMTKIFVSRTHYEVAHREYVCRVPEGKFRLTVHETSGPPREPNPNGEGYLDLLGPWIIRRFSSTLVQPFKGQYGPLAFDDPWWKVVAWIIAAIAAISAVIFATRGQGTVSGGIQCDYDEVTGRTTNCRSPDPEPSNGPTEISAAGIASAIAAYAVKAGLADEIDPWRRGQDATPVPLDEVTLSEIVDVELTPLEDLVAGVQFGVRANWRYSRITDRAIYTFAATDEKKNTALAGKHILRAPSPVKANEHQVTIEAEISDQFGQLYSGVQLFVYVIIKPPAGTGGEFRIVLCDPKDEGVYRGLFHLADAVGQMRERQDGYLGEWRLYLVAQNINLAPDGLPPEEAAKFIGGSPVVAPISVVLRSDHCPLAQPDAVMTVVEA